MFNIFKPRTYNQEWLGKENVSYDIVDNNKRIIRSTVNHSFDTVKKYIQYKNKIKILENDTETIQDDLLTIKYYEYDDIVDILKKTKFKIKEEFGYYDKRSIKHGEEMIFVCTK